MLQDFYFKDEFKCCWWEFCIIVFFEMYIDYFIDLLVMEMGSVVNWYFVKWLIFGIYIWLNLLFILVDFFGEIIVIK